MIEVELKFEIAPDARARLEKYLATIDAARRLQNSDTYYDTPAFDLLSQAVFVRVRNQQRCRSQAQLLHLLQNRRPGILIDAAIDQQAAPFTGNHANIRAPLHNPGLSISLD